MAMELITLGPDDAGFVVDMQHLMAATFQPATDARSAILRLVLGTGQGGAVTIELTDQLGVDAWEHLRQYFKDRDPLLWFGSRA